MDHIRSQYCKLFADSATIQITDGWFWLVSGLCHALDQYSFRSYLKEPFKILKVDQRLGTLCVSYTGGDQGIEKIIRAVQISSNQVCQNCGGIEKTGGAFGEAIHTICEKCWKLDEKFHGCQLSLNQFSEGAVNSILDGLRIMPESWFKKHLEVLI